MKFRSPFPLLILLLTVIDGVSGLNDLSLPEKWGDALKEKVEKKSPGGIHIVGSEWIHADPESVLAHQAIAEAWLELDYPSLAHEMALRGLNISSPEIFRPIIARAFMAAGQPAAAWNAISMLPDEGSLKNQAMASAMKSVAMKAATGRLLAAAEKSPENYLLNEWAILMLFEAGIPNQAARHLEALHEQQSVPANLLAWDVDEILVKAFDKADHEMPTVWKASSILDTARERGLSEVLAESLKKRIDNLSNVIENANNRGLVSIDGDPPYKYKKTLNDSELRKTYLKLAEDETRKRISEVENLLKSSESLSSETILEATDELLALGVSDTKLWASRMQACQQLALNIEAAAAAAQLLALENNPEARALLSESLVKSDLFMAEAEKQAAENNPTEVARALKQARWHNPVSLKPLEIGYRLAAEADADLTASLFLNDYRRMGGTTPNPKEAASIAKSIGNWELLLSLYIEILRQGGEEDFFWNHQLFLSELALNLPGEEASFSCLNGTIYKPEAQLAKAFSGFARKETDLMWISDIDTMKGLEASYTFMRQKAQWNGTKYEKDNMDECRATLNSRKFSEALKLHAQYILGDLSQQELLEQVKDLPGENTIHALCLLEQNRSTYLSETSLLIPQYDPLLPEELKAPLHLVIASRRENEKWTPQRMEDRIEFARLSPDYLTSNFEYMKQVIAAYSRLRPDTLESLSSQFSKKEKVSTSPAIRIAAMADYSRNIKILIEKEKLDPEQCYSKLCTMVLPVFEESPELIFDALLDMDLPDVHQYGLVGQLSPNTRQNLKSEAKRIVHDYAESHSYGDEIYATYPPGSPYYSVVVESQRNGDSMAELKRKLDAAFSERLAKSKKEMASRVTYEEQLKMQAEKRRKRQERLTREFNESLKYRQPTQYGWQGTGSSAASSDSGYSPSTSTPVYQYKPSERQQLQNYRNQLDQQMNRAMGGTGWGAAY